MRPNLRSLVVPSGTVFGVYAWVVGIASVVLLILGPQVFGLVPVDPEWRPTAANTAIALLLFGMALMAAVLGRLPDPLSRRRALLGFALVHVCFCVAALAALFVFDGRTSAVNRALGPLVFMLILGMARWLLTSGPSEKTDAVVTELFGDVPPPSESPLRLAYEAEIREAAGQAERNRLARELHDSIKQEIFAMHASAATAQERFDADPDGARRAIAQVRSSARDAGVEMDALLDQLRAAPLSLTGLIASLEKQCDALALRTGAIVTKEIGAMPPDAALPPGVAQAFFRIAQEALANVARHARASHVKVTLGSKERRLRLLIEDDGAGCDMNRAIAAGGMGLSNMRARAKDIGGAFAFNSATDVGTKVFVSVGVLVQPQNGWLLAVVIVILAAALLAATWDRGLADLGGIAADPVVWLQMALGAVVILTPVIVKKLWRYFRKKR